MVRNVAVRLASTEERQSSSLISSTGAGRAGLLPALATRMSTGPSSCSIWRRMDSMPAKLGGLGGDVYRAPPGLPDPCRDGGGSTLVPAVDGYSGAVLGEQHGDDRTDAA